MRLLIIILLFSVAAQSQQVAKTWVTPAGWTAGLLEYRPPGIDTMTRKPGLIIYSHGNGEASNYTAGQAPTAAAGSNQSITLPTSQVTVNGSSSNDPDGTISTYLWSKISGPSTFTITSPNSSSTTITGLVAGTYVFRLTVTDNDSATGTDDITITVNAAVPGNRRGWFRGSLRNKFRN